MLGSAVNIDLKVKKRVGGIRMRGIIVDRGNRIIWIAELMARILCWHWLPLDRAGLSLSQFAKKDYNRQDG